MGLGTGTGTIASRLSPRGIIQPTNLCVGGISQFRKRREPRSHPMWRTPYENPRAAAARAASTKPDMGRHLRRSADRVEPAAPQGVLSHGHAAISWVTLRNRHAATSLEAATCVKACSQLVRTRRESRKILRKMAQAPTRVRTSQSLQLDNFQPSHCIFCNTQSKEIGKEIGRAVSDSGSELSPPRNQAVTKLMCSSA